MANSSEAHRLGSATGAGARVTDHASGVGAAGNGAAPFDGAAAGAEFTPQPQSLTGAHAPHWGRGPNTFFRKFNTGRSQERQVGSQAGSQAGFSQAGSQAAGPQALHS
ncbi:MAG: hypothetical protein ACUVQQ_15330, partial [Thermogutta sp.]